MSFKFILPLVENSKFGNAIAALITIIVDCSVYGHSLYVVLLWKEVEILYKERKYRGPILMLFFRMGLAVFYIGFY
jgi:CPA2 family monovalent cation:H+ antiporter-2